MSDEQAVDEIITPEGGEESANGAEESATLTPEEQLAQAQAEASNYKDQWLRARAEFANARKRMDKERLDIYGNAVSDIIGRLLPALDDYERALSSVPPQVAEDVWFEGVTLVHRKLTSVLEGLGIEKIVATGHPFDPLLHEAVMREESEEVESGLVTRELQTGYRRGEQVIRPALVAVAT